MIKRNYGWALLTGLIMIFSLMSCEQEDRFVGYNVVGEGAAGFHNAYVELLATTLGPDTLRTDRKLLQNAVIGVYDEPILGKNKAYFYSQVRLGTLNPQFGTNAVVDSVVLLIPAYSKKNDTIATEHRLINTRYGLSNTDNSCTVTDTIYTYETRRKFRLDSIYGNRNSVMTLQVHRVTQSLQSIDSAKYSNQSHSIGELFGSMQFNAEAFTRSTADVHSSSRSDSTLLVNELNPVVRMKLDGMKDFVQQNIVGAQGSSSLGDQVSFLNQVLQGIRIGVAEENGFLLTFNPANINLIAYISSDNASFTDENGNGIDDTEEDCPVHTIKPRKNETLNFIIGSSLSEMSGSKYYNVVYSQIFNEAGSVVYNQTNQPVNYLEGMGGAKVKLSLDPQQIEAVRDSVRNNNWVISQAHFKVYPDLSAQGSWPIPQYLHVYNYTNGKLIPDYGTPQGFTSGNVQAFPFLQISQPYDATKGYYLLRVTEFIKNIVEGNAAIDDLALNMGNYIGNSGSDYFYSPPNAWFSNQAYNPFRLAITGTHPSSNPSHKLQLEILYNKRQN
ncbi:MAG: DUF4270 family protein [Flavobacteriaceae bacterium]|nr:DUF4270 family protein [Flavobacteriaceae bacterium]